MLVKHKHWLQLILQGESNNDGPVTDEPVTAGPPGAPPGASSSTFNDDRDVLIEVDPKTPIALGLDPGQSSKYGSI